ncbi:hypothetical protein KFK09_014210 [Dendrobium nobile]|uniref:Response regulatory domain-containing protein n=1 Tax=Dendrobium nobile TaxID=94219 RepID=A0A8T3BCB5_DENNO|nr:hypothetical protein KFK09_014210 [Dendrobium nobile]
MSESEAMLPDGFPAGMRVFVVDEDSVALRMLEKMLLQCGYEVEQKQLQNSSDSGAQINTDSVDVQSYSLEDHGGSNASNLAILSTRIQLMFTDEVYVAVSQFQY